MQRRTLRKVSRSSQLSTLLRAIVKSSEGLSNPEVSEVLGNSSRAAPFVSLNTLPWPVTNDPLSASRRQDWAPLNVRLVLQWRSIELHLLELPVLLGVSFLSQAAHALLSELRCILHRLDDV